MKPSAVRWNKSMCTPRSALERQPLLLKIKKNPNEQVCKVSKVQFL